MSSITLTIDDRFIPFMISGGLLLLSFICCFSIWIKVFSAIFLFFRICCIKIKSFLMLYLLIAAVALPTYNYADASGCPQNPPSLGYILLALCICVAIVATTLITCSAVSEYDERKRIERNHN